MTKVELDLFYVMTNVLVYIKLQVQISSQYHRRWEWIIMKTIFLQMEITQVKVERTRKKSNLIIIMSRKVHLPGFMSIYQRTSGESLI